MKIFGIVLILVGLVVISGCTTAEPPVKLDLSIDRQPSIGETANLKLTISSSDYSPQTKVSLILPEGMELVDGNLTWEGDLEPNERVEINTRIRVTGDVNLPIRASVQSQNQPEPNYIPLPLPPTPEGGPPNTTQPAPPPNVTSQTPNATQYAPPAGGIFYNGTWECSGDNECAFNQQCINYTCQNFTCSGYCEYYKDYFNNHFCAAYECCSNAECSVGYSCIENQCRFALQNSTNKIAFYSNGTIYIMNNDGTNITKLIDVGYPESQHPAWSPDGRKIAYGHYNIYTINIDGTNKTLLTSGQHPSWTPEEKIVFASSTNALGDFDGIGIIDPDSQNISIILNGYVGFPVVSPDGSRIAYNPSLLGAPENAPRINIMNIDGDNSTFLTIGTDPSWSPDGTKLALNGISIFDIEERNATYLVDGFSPSWSPKGDKIVYDDKNGISVINIDGTNQTKLTNFGSQPAWSPIQT